LVNITLCGEKAFFDLSLSHFEFQLKLAGVRPVDVVAEIVHCLGISVWHLCQFSQLREKWIFHVPINLLVHR
jgi:hypothetical protein